MANKGKTVLITGASTGFGSYLGHAFARGGYRVILHGREETRLKAVHDEIVKNPAVECSIVLADLRDAAGIATIGAALVEHGVDTLINNAAVNPELGGTLATDIKVIDDIMSTNASAAIALCYAALKHFKTIGGGTIININSVAGLRGSAKEVLYASSKFALRGFSESVKEDWLKQGVKMIDAYPGALGTGMSGGRTDVKDLIDPNEFAEFLVGLCSTKSFYVKELNIRRTVV
jgi:short-subunit dehydrogenase